MKTTRRRNLGRWLLLILLVASGLSVQGCFSYTSKYKPDPTLHTVRHAVAPDTSVVHASLLHIEGIPSVGQPDSLISVRAVRTASGPGVEITSDTEQQYKNYWAPAIMPIGWIGVALSPVFVLMSPIIDSGPDRPNKMNVFGGWNPKGCEPRGLLLGYLIFSVGHMPTCEPVGKPRVTESSKPLGRNVTEESPFSGAKLRVSLAETGKTATTEGLVLETNGKGMATVPLTSLLLALPDAVQDIEAVASLEGDPAISARAPIPHDVVQALAGPARAERKGDQATASGRGLIALEHYTRAAGMSAGAGANRELWKKIVATYRSLPVKPPVSEEMRRLLVQAAALTKANDAAGAIAKLSEAILIAPWLPVARYNLATARAMNSEYVAAVDSMNVYLELAPDAPDARQARDSIYEWEALKTAPKQQQLQAAAPMPQAAVPGQQASGPSLGETITNCASQLAAIEACKQLPWYARDICKATAKSQFPCRE